jgi:NADH-quinone oxidoreductase subunit E
MTLSPEMEARFEQFLSKYPPDRKRSALIPMLIYGQDEIGSITDEFMDEVARRVGVQAHEVKDVALYYSMLHQKPMGKYHVQVCTNISCLLVGGKELWEQACHKTGVGHRQVVPGGLVSLEEVECMGACSWAPAVQVNYDFYHDVTPEQLNRLLDGLLAGKTPDEIAAVKRVNP